MTTIDHHAMTALAACSAHDQGFVAQYRTGAAAAVPVIIVLADAPAEPSQASRGGGLGNVGNARIVRTVRIEIVRGSTAAKAVPELKAGDSFDVPGDRVGRPGEATVVLRVGARIILHQGVLWSAEAHL